MDSNDLLAEKVEYYSVRQRVQDALTACIVAWSMSFLFFLLAWSGSVNVLYSASGSVILMGGCVMMLSKAMGLTTDGLNRRLWRRLGNPFPYKPLYEWEEELEERGAFHGTSERYELLNQ